MLGDDLPDGGTAIVLTLLSGCNAGPSLSFRSMAAASCSERFVLAATLTLLLLALFKLDDRVNKIVLPRAHGAT